MIVPGSRDRDVALVKGQRQVVGRAQARVCGGSAGARPARLRRERAVAGWFGRFPARAESREDTYLLDPPLRGLSVKVRAGRALGVKVYHGSPGILAVAGRARGRLQSWQKWSFLQPARLRQWRAARLAASRQTAAHQPVLIGRRAHRGDRRGGGPGGRGARWN